jgi:hypothetical protein
MKPMLPIKRYCLEVGSNSSAKNFVYSFGLVKTETHFLPDKLTVDVKTGDNSWQSVHPGYAPLRMRL